MIAVTKRMEFCYGHHLPGYDGKCAQQHGHNAVVEVTVMRDSGNTAQPSPTPGETYPGMVVDFGDLKKAMGIVIERLDHKNLNDLADGPQGHYFEHPTAENMACYIAYEVEALLPPGISVKVVRVSETPDSWATWLAAKRCGCNV